jgi:hypothetical protein
MQSQNYVNHVVLVLDRSISMRPHRNALIQVADGQVKYLARRSQELDQETRVSIYSFGDDVQCLVYDKDVLRLPSIASLYQISGNTALLDATDKAISDLGQTATLYGDHAFLVYVLTDGQENRSRKVNARDLASTLQRLPDNWTVGVLVPDQRGVFEAKGFGFPAQNIAVWDTTSAAGVVEVGETIQRATESFMTARSTGVRGTRSLFSTGVDAVNRQTVSGLTALTPGSFVIDRVPYDRRMDECTPRIGRGFYQLIKREEIQPQKLIAIRDKVTGQVYLDQQARNVLGLPAAHVKVTPDYNPDYDIFVQSTAPNRKVPANTDVLVLR